ncbi:MAG: ABC transporter permease, partial [Aquiluna sp.]
MKFSLGKYLLPTYVTLTFLFLAIPIGYTFVFSFNDSIKSNIIWRGFTLDNWLNVCGQQEVCDAFGNSIIVAVSATLVSTVLGTMIAIALVRYRFKFRNATNLILFLPLATPEVVMGAGLAAQFLDFGWQKGLGTVIIAHTMFTLSFVVVTVKARVATLD